MTKAYEAPAVAAVTPVDEPLIVGPTQAPSVANNPQWTEESDES